MRDVGLSALYVDWIGRTVMYISSALRLDLVH